MYKNWSEICFIVFILIYTIISLVIFNEINETAKVVVDEEFHLPQGEAYCKFEFTKWNPKITTLPGLYMVSSLFLGPFQLCTTYWLRFISFTASIINIPLYLILFHLNNRDSLWRNVASSFNVALLPPLYFFSHFYYTDVVSVTMILLMLIFAESGKHYFASIFGLLSILFRQTNIVWLGMVFGQYVLREFHVVYAKKTKGKQPLRQVWKIVKQTSLEFWLNTLSYLTLILSFLVFIYLNGGLVVGDKTAHEVTLHLPQILYFSLFCCVFLWPYFVGDTKIFMKFVNKHRLAFAVSFIFLCLVVYFNTLIHPYLLADNRHYVFYIWNRFYGKFFLFRFLIIPVYLFSLFGLFRKLFNKNDASFLLLFLPCTFLVLITQKLLEFRYFLVPFILFRLQIRSAKKRYLFYEFFTHLLVNVVTLYLFFNKTIQWTDYDYPQRLIW